MAGNLDRRDFIKKTLAASAGAAAIGASLEERQLMAQEASASTQRPVQAASKGMPAGKIGNVQISRLICGGNLINGYAHSRDLIYVSNLLQNYFTDEKIFETWEKCEANGINTCVTHVTMGNNEQRAIRLLNKYWNERGGSIQWLAQCVPHSENYTAILDFAIDHGATGIFLMGGTGDHWVKNERVDLIGKVVDYVKQNGLIAGVAGHSVKVPEMCEKEGVDPDFYVKTFHHGNYWSCTPEQERVEFNVDSGSEHDHDNIWAIAPDETVTLMEKVNKPWIAYKTLAAGAIAPQDGFEYAFTNGADFILAGMFDFQVIEDAIIAKKVLAKNLERKRPWMA